MSQDNPTRKVTVSSSSGDIDISQDAISTIVEKLENGIDMVTLIANNDDGKAYLATLHVGDNVTVKGLAQSNQAYYNDGSVDWSLVLPCFRGTIQETSPILSRDNQVCKVVAFGFGYNLKEMRINQLYGQISPVPFWNNVFYFDGIVDQWLKGYQSFLTPYSVAPYLNGWKVTSFIYTLLAGGGVNNQSGGYVFGLDPDFNQAAWVYAQLHIVAALYQDSGGHFPTAVQMQPYWTTDVGSSPTWHSFTDSIFHDDTNSTTNITGHLTAVTGGGIPVWNIPITWTYDDTYYPPKDYSHGPPLGNDFWVDITPDIPVFNSNFRVKLGIAGVSGTIQGGISVNMMYLAYQLVGNQGKSVRDLLAGEHNTIGIIPSYVNSIFNGLVPISVGYPPIGTDYIMKDDVTVPANLIPELKLPYTDTFMALQDVIRMGSGLKFLQGLSGYHWIIDTAGNLLVAQCGFGSATHHVIGKDAYHYVDDGNNGTIPWVSQPVNSPIVVKQTMISQSFTQKVPTANFVLISGKYQYPVNDAICTDPDISPTGSYPSNSPTLANWKLYHIEGTGSSPNGEQYVTSDQIDIDAGGSCLTFYPRYADQFASGSFLDVYFYTLPTDLNFIQLMGRDTEPTFNFLFKATGGITGIQLRLYWDNGSGQPDTSQFLTYGIGNGLQTDLFNPVSVSLPNIKYLKDYKGWSIGQDNFNFPYFGHSTTKTVEDIGSVKYLAIAFVAKSTGGVPFCRMSKFTINGAVIKGAFDSKSISGPYTYSSGGVTTTYPNGFGCRMITIKNSMANTDSLIPINPADPTTWSPLDLEIIYELQRNRIPFLTGEVTIPFDPQWLAGQQVKLQAEDIIPLGVQVLQGAGNPLSSTVCQGIGSYFVNTVTWEVFLCTNVVGAVYTWTDQNAVRYKVNQWFRITKVTHEFTSGGAFTKLQVTNDFYSSIPITTLDPYTTAMRMINPDFQSHTTGSLKSAGDFDQGLVPILTDFQGY